MYLHLVDGAIHAAAGPELLDECQRIPVREGKRCGVGEARLTRGYQLPAKCMRLNVYFCDSLFIRFLLLDVIHTVGPRVTGPQLPVSELESCYNAVLSVADENGIASVAFCGISMC